MTREEARERLDALNQVIATAVLLIRSEREILDQFFVETSDMESFGHIIDPTLYRNTERRDTVEIIKPLYEAARNLVKAYDEQTKKAVEAHQRLDK